MKLYDIFYKDGTMDRNIPLPKRAPRGTKYARCTNWDGHIYVPKKGAWVKGENNEKL